MRPAASTFLSGTASGGKKTTLPTRSSVQKTPSEQWAEENREAIAQWNDHVEQHGLLLARFRRF